MVIDFSNSLDRALERVDFVDQLQFILDSEEMYGSAKWYIVDAIAHLYGDLLVDVGLRRPDLYNWLFKRQDDEVSYFLCEAGANVLHHAHVHGGRFVVYFGKMGFIIGIEQVGQSFNALQINEDLSKKQGGGGFSFFRECKGMIFFDDFSTATCVYYAYFFE